jgi:ABC-type dipeptide/oligopeptide/nickel transport system permease subunit
VREGTGETPVPPELQRALREVERHWPRWLLGTDALGRSLLWRVLAGGGISLAVGLLAASVSVTIGTLYGAIAGMAGGRVDGVMMRVVDVLYGLPYVLLVVLLAVASDALVSEFVSRQKARQALVREQARELVLRSNVDAQAGGAGLAGRTGLAGRAEVDAFLQAFPSERTRLEERARAELPARDLSPSTRALLDLSTLLVAIGGMSWLTMSRVVRGQVMSLRAQPFMEAARALGLSRGRIFVRHLLPNLAGTITVYATLTVPQAILQESFLSFLGIGVKPPLASWGNLAADGLGEINPYQSHWWLPVFPCVLLSLTLLALNFTGEALREALDPKRARRGV